VASSADPAREAEHRILAVPLNRHFGLLFDGRVDGVARGHFMVSGPLAAFGMLNGGVLYGLLDSIAMLALLPMLDAGQHAVTHDLHVSVLRPTPLGARCELFGKVLRLGRGVAFLDAHATVEDRVVAAARVTKSLTTAH